MKYLLVSALVLATSLPTAALAANETPAEAAPAAVASPAADLEALVGRIRTKLQAGQNTPEALAAELAEFDALLAKYADVRTEEVARIAIMKALLYVQVFEQTERGIELITAVANDFPGTEAAAQAGRLVERIKSDAEAKAKVGKLVGQPAPPLNFTWSSVEGLRTLEDLKGKVVVLDFWATWCGPCVASFPQVRELTAHYAGHDVVVVGVTSLQGRVFGLEAQPIDCRDDPAKEMQLMNDYIKAKDITWTVVFSEQEVFNPDYGIRGIPYVAILAPDGTVRHAGLHPASPLAEKTAKIDAILAEFGRKVPGA